MGYKISTLLTFAMIIVQIVAVSSQCDALYINGVIDGPLPGGTPKAIQLCSNNNIAELSDYGVETANNGSPPSGVEFTMESIALDSAECVWISKEQPGFLDWFGFDPCMTHSSIDGNGDDTYLLYCSGNLVDVYGVPGVDGSGEAWEYTDGWANANDTSQDTVFDINAWNYSGIDALDGELNNSTAAIPYPDTDQMCNLRPDIWIGDIDMAEGNDSSQIFTIVLSLEFSISSDIELHLFTIDSTALVADNDYLPIDTSALVIPSGNDSLIVNLTVIADTFYEPDEIFIVEFSELTDLCNLVDSSALVTIINDDNVFSQCDQLEFNELHYDNIGTDTMQFVEIRTAAGSALTLSNYELLRYDGDSGLPYGNPANLGSYSASGYDSLFNYYCYDLSLQNGSPDGILIYDTIFDQLCTFISYEGIVTIDSIDTYFPGFQSQDIGVEESNATTLTGESLQKADTAWFGPVINTYASQNISPCELNGLTLLNSECNGSDFSLEAHFSITGGSGSYGLIDGDSGNILATDTMSPIHFVINNSNTPDTMFFFVRDQNDFSCHTDTLESEIMDCIPDGINCWDLNGNGSNDPEEDINGDGYFTAADCQGSNGIYAGSGTVPDSTLVQLEHAMAFADSLLVLDGNDNRIGIGTNNPQHTLDILGDVGVSGNIYGLSDARMKKDIKSINNALSLVGRLNPVMYYFIDQGQPHQRQYGFLAQDLEKILPELVYSRKHADGRESLGINYIALIPFLVSSVQEQADRIEALEKKLDTRRIRAVSHTGMTR